MKIRGDVVGADALPVIHPTVPMHACVCVRERERARERERERKREGGREGGKERESESESESERPIRQIEEHMRTVAVPRVRLESSLSTKRVFSL
jgi:hypothetical protein